VTSIAFAADDELKTVMEGIKFNESLLKDGQGIFVVEEQWGGRYLTGDPEARITPAYPETKGRISWRLTWVFKDKKVRVDSKPIDSIHEKFYRQDVFDGEKYIRFEPHGKFARISSERLWSATSYPTLFIRINPKESLSTTLENAESVKVVGTEKLNDSLCYVLDVRRKDDSFKHRVWIDPAKGFGVRKIKQERDSKLAIRTITILVKTFKKYGSGIFFPEEATYECHNFPEGSEPVLVFKKTLVTKEFKPNINPSDDFFKIEFPPGTHIYDRILGIEYEVPKIDELPSTE
jgi:hypothetical protein